VESHEYHRTVTDSAHANGSVFGRAISLVDAQIIAKSVYSDSYGGSGSAETDFTVTLQGVQPFAPVQVLSPKKSELYMDRKTLATSTWSPDFPSVSIGAGPYSVDITVTLAAHADIDAAYNVLYASARADLMPASSLNVAVSASVSFPGIEIGVDGRMRVFDHHFELANQAELVEPGREAKLALTNSGTDRFDALSGALSVFIKVGWGPFSHRFDVDIFSKTGNHQRVRASADPDPGVRAALLGNLYAMREVHPEVIAVLEERRRADVDPKVRQIADSLLGSAARE
jgi:hypothetical protein